MIKFIIYYPIADKAKDEKSEDKDSKKKEEKPKESSYFDLKLASFDAGKKLGLIKEIRTYLNLGLKEAKELVEKTPVVIKKNVHKLEAEEIKNKLATDCGAVLEFV